MLKRLRILCITDVASYAYHRFMHCCDNSLHMRHHEDSANPWLIWQASVPSGILATTSSYVLGLGHIPFAYWSIVSLVHPLLHEPKLTIKVPPLTRWIAYLHERHEIHHQNPHYNFGPLFPICDVIFATQLNSTQLNS